MNSQSFYLRPHRWGGNPERARTVRSSHVGVSEAELSFTAEPVVADVGSSGIVLASILTISPFITIGAICWFLFA